MLRQELGHHLALGAVSYSSGLSPCCRLTQTVAANSCNEDGTNKRSTCERKHTSDQYEYDFLEQPLGDDKTITFSVKAANDAHVR